MRTKRRSRSGSVTDRRLRSHSPRTNSGSLHCHKTKQSVGSRHSVSPSPIQNCSKKSELLSSEPILSSSNMTASTTSLSNDEGGLEEKRKRAMQQRRASITGSDGVEVPPGFPVAAVENTAQVVGQENEESDDAKIGSPNLEARKSNTATTTSQHGSAFFYEYYHASETTASAKSQYVWGRSVTFE